MGAAIGDILGLAAGVAVSPLPIVAMILLLATPPGRVNGSRPAPGAPAHVPKWMAGLDKLAAGRGARPRRPPLGRQPKSGGLTIAAAATVAGAGLTGGEQAVALASFVPIGSTGVLAPLIVYLVLGAGAAETLDTWRTWAADHNAAIMAVLFLVFAFKLVGDGIAVLS